MKKFLLFILASISANFSIACWFYPSGESIRFTFQNYMNLSVPREYMPFLYSSDYFTLDYQETDFDENILDWHNMTNKKVNKESIHQFLYHSSTSVSSDSDNEFIQYLYAHKKQGIIDYLKIAKACEPFNGVNYNGDLWERGNDAKNNNKSRAILIKKIDEALAKEKDANLIRRYAFLRIRLDFYNQNYKEIKSTFERYFSSSKEDYLYYWSLYFYCFTEGRKSIDIAKIMANSPQKAQIVYNHFNSYFNLQEALSQSKNNHDKTSAYIFASCQRLAPNLDYLQKIYELEPGNNLLELLLFREVQKLEDWILTPYYSNFLPSVIEGEDSWEMDQATSMQSARFRSENDRKYAEKLLKFVQSVNLKTVKKPNNWKYVEIQLLFMSRSFDQCIKKGKTFLKDNINYLNNTVIDQIITLAQIANQPAGKVVLTDEIKAVIEKNWNEHLFIFAVGRELEFKNQLPEAVAFLSLVNNHFVDGNFEMQDLEDVYGYSYVWWRGNHSKKSTNLFYFDDYFNYVDYTYSAAQLKSVLDYLKTPSKDAFYSFLFKKLTNSKSLLMDLLGTKYIRENKLDDALVAFQSVGSEYWDRNYSRWERDKYDDGSWVFDANPFYDLKHTPNFITKREKMKLSKPTIVEKLIEFQQKSNDVNNPNNAYYSFIVANCYFNMSQFGNSWMLRRFQSTTNFNWDMPSYVDETEYRENKLALKYYYQAYQQAKNRKFKALSLRMYEWVENHQVGFYDDDLNPNESRKASRLEKEFSDYSEELSNCYKLENYFKP